MKNNFRKTFFQNGLRPYIYSMDINQIIANTDQILSQAGLKVYVDYIWSLQGPTVIPLGEPDSFQGLPQGTFSEIKKAGALFLIDPEA